MCIHGETWSGTGPNKESTVVVVVAAQCSCNHPSPKNPGGGSGQSTMIRPAAPPGDSEGTVCNYGHFTTEKDIERISSNWQELNMCYYYYGGISSPQAKALLQRSPVGTFLIRDSSNPKYLYSLSLQTERGATSVRIEYSHGTFRLDCEDRMKSKMPRFVTVMKLIDHYVTFCQSETSRQCRWLESSGRRDVHVVLTRPRLASPPSLKHICRVTVNSALQSVDKLHDLPLPKSVKQYILDYPYRH